MGRVVNLSPTAMKVSLFGDNSNYMSSYIQHQMQNMNQGLQQVGNRIYETLHRGYEQVTDALRRYSIRSELEREGVVELDNYFSTINTFEGLQNANITMQRWIMAEPTLKEIYLDQNCYGYADSYVNISGDTFGEEDYDFRRVMNGIVQVNEKDDTAVVNLYVDDLIPGDRELDFYEQCQILDTWDTMRYIMSHTKADFTKEGKEPDLMNV